MSKTNTEKIGSIDEQMAQLAARKKRLIQQENQRLRKERNSRLYRRHGLLEKYMPSLAVITDQQFDMFIRRAIDTGYGQKILAELVSASGQSTDYASMETPDEDEAENGESMPKAERSGA